MKVPVVKEFMTRKVQTLAPDMEMSDAIKLLVAKKRSGAPVVDGSGRLIGMLSEKDCLHMFVEGAFDKYPGGKVAEFMQTDLMTCEVTDGLYKVADLFFKRSFRRLPVMDEGKMVGIVSRKDVLMACIQIWKMPPEEKVRWTDSTYFPDEVIAMLRDKGTPDRADVRIDSTE